LAAEGCRTVVAIGGGNGILARHLADHGVNTVVVDTARHITDAPRPAVLADALRLPFPTAPPPPFSSAAAACPSTMRPERRTGSRSR
jgi:hypothetical protein